MANYGDADDLYDMFGEKNVKEWANMQELDEHDSDFATEIARRITAGFTYATEDINDLLRDGPYEVPFTTVPESIKHCACLKAGAWLFEWRKDTDVDRYDNMLDKANEIIEQIKRGVRKFDPTIQTIKGSRNPGVVTA